MYEKIIAFDLSTSSTGVAIGSIQDLHLKTLTTKLIKPDKFKPSQLGYLNTKKQVITKKGEKLSSFVKFKDEAISKTEKERRDRVVKLAAEEFRLSYIAEEIQCLLEEEAPSRILMEANMSFRNIDVTRKLAEISGVLQSSAVAFKIPLEKINVHTARSLWNTSKECSKYAKLLSPEVLKKIDLTKETLKYLVLQEFSTFALNQNMSLDESDALVLLCWWLKQNERGYLSI